MKISFYLKKPASETETNIYARFRLNNQYVKYYTTESIKPKFWNKKNQRAYGNQKFPQYPEFNNRLSDIAVQIEKQINRYQNQHGGSPPEPDTLKEILDSIYKPSISQKNEKLDFLELFKEIINRSEKGTRLNLKSGNPISNSRIKSYNTAFSRLEAFKKKQKQSLAFESIDLDFYNSYVAYLTNDLNLATNTIGGQINIIKMVMNEAVERGLTTNIAHLSRRFKRPVESADNIYLTTDELVAMEELDLTDNLRLDKARDIFLIGCYTGQRYEDWSGLKSTNIKDGRIYLTQAKTGRDITLPIHKVVKRIIDKYDGNFPPSISSAKMNKYIKEVAALIPQLKEMTTKKITKGGKRISKDIEKFNMVSTHTARRSFCTNEYLAGTSTLTIMAISGHTTEREFLKYIKLSQNDHAQQQQEIWARRDAESNSKAIPSPKTA